MIKNLNFGFYPIKNTSKIIPLPPPTKEEEEKKKYYFIPGQLQDCRLLHQQ